MSPTVTTTTVTGPPATGATASSAARAAVAAHLWATYRLPFLIFVALFALAWIVLAVILGVNGDVIASDLTDVLRWATVPPVKYFLFTIAIIVAAVQLRIYVAFGLTRRDVVLGGARFFAIAAPFMALYSQLLYLAIAVVSDLVDAPPPAGYSHVAAIWALLLAFLGFLAWTASGGLVGLGFVRFGAWGGIAFLPVAAVPAAAAEIAYLAPFLPAGIGLVAGAAVVVVVGVLLASGWVALRLARGVEVRKVAS